MAKRQVCLSIPAELYEKLRQIAEKEGRSLSNLIAFILNENLNK